MGYTESFHICHAISDSLIGLIRQYCFISANANLKFVVPEGWVHMVSSDGRELEWSHEVS